jgi:hypothetical protein
MTQSWHFNFFDACQLLAASDEPSNTAIVLAIGTALISILGGGVIAALVGHYTALHRSDREYRLKKLEELYSAVHRLGTSQFGAYSQLVLYSNSPPTVETRVRLAEANKESNDKMGERFTSIIAVTSILFPELEGAFAAWRETYQTITAPVLLLIKASDRTEQTKAIQCVSTSYQEHFRMNDEFKKALLRVAKRIRTDGLFRWLRGFGD